MPAKSAAKARDPIDRRNDRILSLDEVCKIMGGIHRVTVWRRRQRDSRFPTPVNAKLSGGDFWESDIYQYLELTRQQSHVA